MFKSILNPRVPRNRNQINLNRSSTHNTVKKYLNPTFMVKESN